MAWTNLKAAVAAVIRTNGNQEITGALLQSTLNSIIDQVGGGSTFKGLATPATIPGTPDGPQFYLAQTAGTYSNFGSLVVNAGELVALNYSSGTWVKAVVGANFQTYTDSQNLLGNYSDLKFQLRKNKVIAYDPSTKKIKVVGSDTMEPTDLIALTVCYKVVSYVIKASVGSEQTMGVVGGHSQIGILTTVADPSNVLLSDFVVYNDTFVHDNFIKLAHIVYNDGVTSEVIKDYRNYYPSIRTKLDALERKGIFNGDFLLRMNKYLTYDSQTACFTLTNN